MAQKPWIVPIPGTTNLDHLRENIGAINVQLTPADLREIETAFSRIEIYGGRMDARQMAQIGHEPTVPDANAHALCNRRRAGGNTGIPDAEGITHVDDRRRSSFRHHLDRQRRRAGLAAQLPLTLDMSELNGNEKHAELPQELCPRPRADRERSATAM